MRFVFFSSSMAKLLRHLRPSLPARLMASRLFSSPSHKNHNFISPSSLSGLFLYPRAFMSSSHDDKAFEGMDVAAPDSSEETKNYFVDIGSGAHTERDDPKRFTATHIDILASVLGSKEAALKSLVPGCEGSAGFVANLTRSQAMSLGGDVGLAVSASPCCLAQQAQRNMVVKTNTVTTRGMVMTLWSVWKGGDGGK